MAVSRQQKDGRVAEKFGENLSRIRVREGLSQRSLAARASLHRTEIDKLESGRRVPRVDTLIDLARAMAVLPAELIEGIVADPPDPDPDPAGNSAVCGHLSGGWGGPRGGGPVRGCSRAAGHTSRDAADAGLGRKLALGIRFG